MVFIYILELENNKYYVGKTNNINFRLEEHFSNNGSQWTKTYKPLRIKNILPNCDDFDEDKYVLKMMNEKGINNVRGGSFSQIKLSEKDIILIKKMLKTSSDKCYLCGSNEHFVKDCFLRKKNKDLNKKCDCATSYFSPHRISKCFIKNIF